ncbi:MAG TPA: FAD-binding oxidoreductase [Dehalococcoidia bacterium]
MTRSKWWGWGLEGESYHLPDPERFWSFVRERLGKTEPAERLESAAEITVSSGRVPDGVVSELTGLLGAQSVTTDDATRAVFSLGKGYKDLVRIRRGEVPNATDLVATPATEDHVLEILRMARRHGLAVIPFGGGTSVVGGVEPTGDRPSITLDLAELSRPLTIDQHSATATVQAGIMGPDLERFLNPSGFTLGHFPQSFVYSTVGGWIATRSAGQNSTRYGTIAELVQSLRVAHPDGLLATPNVPAAAAGPDLVQVVTGSEGTLGVITQATLRLARLPEHDDYRGYLLPSFAEGVEAAREIMQSDLTPAVLRLSDEAETESTLALRAPPKGFAGVVEGAGRWYLGRRGLSLESGSVMILGFEGDEAEVRHERAAAKRILSRHGAFSIGKGAGRAWKRGRYDAPLLRDTLLDHGIMVETLETAVPWDRYLALHAAVRDALRQALGERSVVMAHLSHSYRDGGSIYYTFLAPQEKGAEVEQWERAKAAATDAIVRNGGALSHHHGIGAEHRRWMPGYLGEQGARWLSAIKTALDPDDILNPGKLVPPPEPSRSPADG